MTNNSLFQKRVKTPTILQMESTECGSTSLSIIMAFYKKFITAEEARIACSISRDGTKAINIVKAARHYGMDAYGANLDIEQLQEKKVPFIAYWEFNHFLVVEGYSSTKVYLNDPATGPRTVTWEEFKKSYTGVALIMYPGDSFQPGGKAEIPTFKMLLNRLGENQLALLFIVLITLGLIIPKISLPIFTKAFIDYVLIDNQSELILAIFLGIGFTTLAETVLTGIQKHFLYRLTMKLEIVNAVGFFWHLLHIPIRYFQQRSSGDIVERSLISEKVAKILAYDFPAVIVGCIEVIIFYFVVFVLSWQIGLSLFFIIFFSLIIPEINKKRIIDLGRRYAQDKGKLEGIETNGIQIIETLKTAALEQEFFDRWIAFYTQLMNTVQRLYLTSNLLNIIPNFLGFFVNILIICYGSYLVMRGKITIGTIVAIQALVASFLPSLNRLIAFINSLHQLKGDLMRLNDVIDTKIESVFSDVPHVLDDSLNTDIILQINNLSFGYSPLEPPVIDDLSLSIHQGQHVAIVGPSGSGKSSLAKLICALYQPAKGEILLHNLPFKKISRSNFCQFIAYVDQHIFFFSGSLRDNLTMWDDQISDEKIYACLKKVNIYDEIMLRGGLGMTLAERGSNFSGGECQRLEIARALLRCPKLLILDEATAAMDPHLEASIYTNLRAMNCSVLIITHRLHAIRNSDNIYVLSQGKIIQKGAHYELIEQPGLYKELVDMESA